MSFREKLRKYIQVREFDNEMMRNEENENDES